MLNKTSYNFFSGQDYEMQKGRRSLIIGLAAVALLLVAAVGFILWGRMQLQAIEQQNLQMEATLKSPENQEKLAEITKLQQQSQGLDEYISLADTLLEKVNVQNFASSDNLSHLLSLIPALVEVTGIDINGTQWQLTCKSNTQQDVAVLLHSIEESPRFAGATSGSLTVDEVGLIAFTVQFRLEGEETHAAE